MEKQLVIFEYISSWTIGNIFEKLSEFDNTSNLTVRLNSGGGEVTSGFAFLSRLSEITGKKKCIVDGTAASMAAIWLPFFDEVVANDTSEIIFHKAAYPSWVRVTDEMQKDLDDTNKKFEEKLKRKVEGKEGAEEFLAKLFEKGVRNDVKLTPAQAKKLGIVTSVRKLNPTAFQDMKIVAYCEIEDKEVKPEANQSITKKPMEITQAMLEAARKDGYEAGKKAEFDRVNAFAQYIDIDKASALAGIADPKAEVNAVVMAKMQVTAMSNARLAAHADDSAGAANPGAEKSLPKTPEQEAAERAQAIEEAIMKM